MATAQFFGEVPEEGAAESATVADAEKLLAGLSLDKGQRARPWRPAAGTPRRPGWNFPLTANTNTATTSRRRRRCASATRTRGRLAQRTSPPPPRTPGDTPAFATWALLTFDQPITCPVDSLYIASRFDTDIHQNTCRLAFHGRARSSHRPGEGTGSGEADQSVQDEAGGDGGARAGRQHGDREGDVQKGDGPRDVLDGGADQRRLGDHRRGFRKEREVQGIFQGWHRADGRGEAVRMYLRFKRYVFDKEGKKMVQ